jgi:hypothetical protein
MPTRRKTFADALSKEHDRQEWLSLSSLCGALMLIAWCTLAA